MSDIRREALPGGLFHCQMRWIIYGVYPTCRGSVQPLDSASCFDPYGRIAVIWIVLCPAASWMTLSLAPDWANREQNVHLCHA